MVTYKITRKVFGELKSSKLNREDFSRDLLDDSSTFGLTAFIDSKDDNAKEQLESEMIALRDAIDWKSEVQTKEYSSEVYGEGYSVNIMREAVKPKLSQDDMRAFIASLSGSVAS